MSEEQKRIRLKAVLFGILNTLRPADRQIIGAARFASNSAGEIVIRWRDGEYSTVSKETWHAFLNEVNRAASEVSAERGVVTV